MITAAIIVLTVAYTAAFMTGDIFETAAKEKEVLKAEEKIEKTDKT